MIVQESKMLDDKNSWKLTSFFTSYLRESNHEGSLMKNYISTFASMNKKIVGYSISKGFISFSSKDSNMLVKFSLYCLPFCPTDKSSNMSVEARVSRMLSGGRVRILLNEACGDSQNTVISPFLASFRTLRSNK